MAEQARFSPRLFDRGFTVEAAAPGGRFTRARIAGREVLGPVVGNPSLHLDLEAGETTAAAVQELLDKVASRRDVAAWAEAARWWLGFAERLYLAAVNAAPDLTELGIPATGPADPRMAPTRVLPGFGRLGGQDLIRAKPGAPRGQLWLGDMTWPGFFRSLSSQIDAKAAEGGLTALVHIQVALRHVAAFMHDLATGQDLRAVTALLGEEGRRAR